MTNKFISNLLLIRPDKIDFQSKSFLSLLWYH